MSTDAKAAAAKVWNAGWGEVQPPAQANEAEKLCGMLANVLGLIFIVGSLVAWFVKPSSKFVKFYALQMIFLHLAGLAVGIVLNVLLTPPPAAPSPRVSSSAPWIRTKSPARTNQRSKRSCPIWRCLPESPSSPLE